VSAAVAAGAAVLGAALDARAGEKVHLLVFMEHGVGTAAQAQPYVDKLVDAAKKENGWDGAEGKYVTKRKQADEYISANSPKFGIYSLSAFLHDRKGKGLAVVGVAEVETAGGRKFHIVSKSAGDLAGCKGKKLASSHLSDKKFIDKVVADGAFTEADFELVKTKRPVEPIKKVIKDEATCALIDDAQYAELSHIDGASGIKSVWSSQNLPPMAVVAFSSAGDAERAKFKASLGKLCAGAGQDTCDKVGIKSLRAAEEGAVFGGVIKKYEQ
jgi:hypothetical protein